MFPSVLILGRQPSLGLAELESLYGADALQPIGGSAVLLNVHPQEVSFNRLGGSIKLAKVLTSFEFTDWSKLVDYLVRNIPEHLDYLPEGKLKLGVSVFDLPVSVQSLNRSTLAVKKAIKNAGRSIRVVPNNGLSLNSAQVRHNQLTSVLGMELLLIKNGSKTILAQTVVEQDIDAYAARDQQRPKRDSRVGMLPPKLAQIIVNLTQPKLNSVLLDPFCGTGVILQESLLMGLRVHGSDLEPRMVEYATDNLAWLEQQYTNLPGSIVETGDATNFLWPAFDAMACETYLGRPFAESPKPEVLREVMQDVNLIHKRFLQNVAKQTPAGLKLCIAVPAWKTHDGFQHLKTLDSLEELGYTRTKFVHAKSEDLIYYRSGQVVARELVVLTRK